MRKIKIASWNIAGGRLMKSLAQFDYEKEDLDYLGNELKKISPDIICLQETHTNKKRSVARELAKLLGYSFIFNSPTNPSHIDPEYLLGNSIISRVKFQDEKYLQYPDPWFELYFADGRKAITHHKGLQIAKVKDVFIVNTQLLPIRLFGYDYDRSEGAGLARKIEEVLLVELSEPLIFCGDLNIGNPQLVFPKIFSRFNLKDALPNKATRPTKENIKETPDHILYSSEFKFLSSDVIKTQTDHYLCWAEFRL